MPAIAAIPGDGWTEIRYPKAVFDEELAQCRLRLARLRRNAGDGPPEVPAGHRVVVLFRCLVTRQFVSELGMYPPGTWDGA